MSVYRWVQRFTALLIDAARPCRDSPGDRWYTDETYVKVARRWTYFYRAIDRFGQVIDVLASEKRDLAAARRFFTRALAHGRRPAEVTTDRAAAYPRVLDELLPAAHHVDARYANNKVEVDHGRLKARLRPMRGLKRLRSAQVIGSGHAFVQNSAAATTNSASTPNPIADSQQCSPNSPWLSDAMKGRGLRSLVTAPG